MTNPKLFDTGEEFAMKNGFDGETFTVGLFNRNQNQLSDSDDIVDINTEPNGGLYARQTSTFSSFDSDAATTESTELTADWAVSNDDELVFEVDNSTNTIDAFFIAKEFQSEDKGDSSPNLHLISSGLLERTLDLSGGNLKSQGDEVLTVRLPSDDIGIRFGVKIRGDKVFTADVDNAGKTAYRHNLNTEYDITSIITNEQSLDVSFEPFSIEFNIIGSKMYLHAQDGGEIYQYQLTDRFDITTATLEATVSLEAASSTGVGAGIRWSDDGTKLFENARDEGSRTANTTYEYNVSTAFDARTASATGNTITAPSIGLTGLCWNDGGGILYTATDLEVHQYFLDSQFDLSTVNNSNTEISRGNNSEKGSLFWSNDGTRLFQVNTQDGNIEQAPASAQFDLTTVSFSSQDVENIPGGEPSGLVFNTSPKYIGKD